MPFQVYLPYWWTYHNEILHRVYHASNVTSNIRKQFLSKHTQSHVYLRYLWLYKMKFFTGIAHEKKPIPHTKPNFETSTDAIGNDVIMVKF